MYKERNIQFVKPFWKKKIITFMNAVTGYECVKKGGHGSVITKQLLFTLKSDKKDERKLPESPVQLY